MEDPTYTARRLDRLIRRLGRLVDAARERVATLDDRWEAGQAKVAELEARLVDVEDRRPVLIVATLPDEAPAGTLLRLTTTGDLYLGNGPGRPLSRFTPAAAP